MKLDRRSLIASALALAACGEKAPEQAAPPPPPPPARPEVTPITDLGSVKALLEERRAATHVPALAAAVFNAQDFLMEAATGVRRDGEPSAVTTRDPWHIGSCTKAMTAALYARLVEKGRAKWGAKLPALFPDLAPEMDPAWANTTIDEVFRHRAGLSNIDARWLIVLRNDRRGPQPQRTSTAREWLSKPPGARPGDFLYSNTGYMIAGAAIERITKSSWEDAIAEHVFKPLKMEAAGFGPPLGDAPQGHGSGPLGGFTPKGVGPAADNPPALGPAGTVHVTFEDWAKFVRVFFDPKQTFLKPETVQRLVTPEPGQDYAYGWGVSDKPETGRVITHTGSNTMWMAQVAIQPDQGLASFVATNCGGGPADAATGGVVASLLAAIKSGTIK